MSDQSLFWHSDSLEKELETRTRQIIAGRFRLLCILGKGGFGQVWKAKDLWLKQEIALKISQSDLAQETLLLRKLPKDRYVSIFDYVKDEDLQIFAYSMEILDSPWVTLERFYESSLQPNLIKGRFIQPLRLILHIVIDVLLGLQVLHGKKYGKLNRWCHADIKPQNLYINKEAASNVLNQESSGDAISIAKIGDLGLARESGSMLNGGTREYMGPEQNGNKNISAATDIFAVGQTLAFLICGDPFDEADLVHIKRMRDQLATRIDSGYLVEKVLDPLRKMTMRAPTQRANSHDAIKMLRGVVKSEVDWVILSVFEKNSFTINQAAEELFLRVAPRRNWANRTLERMEEMKKEVISARKRGLLYLDGHGYILRNNSC